MLLTATLTTALAGHSPYTFTCTRERLTGVHPHTLRVYRNEVFARHGRPFTSADLQAAFSATAWYTPDPEYTDARLTDADRACLAHIQALEQATGSRPPTTLGVPDLDGDGTPDPVTWDGHTLTVGSASTVLVPGTTTGVGLPSPVVIDLHLADGLQELLLTVDPGVEDEWSFLVVQLRAGAITRLLGPAWMSSRAYTVAPGMLVDQQTNCGQHTVTKWRLADGRVTQHQSTTGTYTPEQCVACPYVYRLDGSEAGFVGEVLRDQRHPELEATDRLPLGPVPAGPLRLRLLELKPETTLLDAIFVEVNGVRVAPASCPGSAWCTDDGTYETLHSHAGLDLVFPIPEAGTATVVADGYYLPHQPAGVVAGQIVLVPAATAAPPTPPDAPLH